MNTLWCFGDSYTQGAGLGDTEPYRKYESVQEKWVDIISSKYNYKLLNFGDGGISNQDIQSRLISNLSNIKSGDVVIIGDTVPTRTIGVSQKRQNINNSLRPVVTFNNDTLTQGFYESDVEVLPENLNTYINYVYEFLYVYSEIWESYYIDIFFDLKKELELRNIEVYFWSHRLWYVHKKFNSIYMATNTEVKDHHWSWEGHRQFSNYMINRIDNKIYIDDSDLIPIKSIKYNLDGSPINKFI